MKAIKIKVAPRAASATLLAASQSVSGASPLVLTTTASLIDPQTNTSFLPNGLGRIVQITSAGNDSGLSAVIVGTDPNGAALTETIAALGSTAAVVSVNHYTSVSSITLSGSSASTIEAGIVGTTLSAQLPCLPLDGYQRVASVVQVDLTGTISYTVQMTFDDCSTASATPYTNQYWATPATPTALTAQSANKYDTLVPGVTGIVVTIPTYSTGATLTVNVVSPSNATSA